MSGLNTIHALLEARNKFGNEHRADFDEEILKQLADQWPKFKPVLFKTISGEWTAGFLLERFDNGGIRVLIPSGEWRVVRAKQSASVISIIDSQRSMFDALLAAQDKFYQMMKLFIDVPQTPPAKGSAKDARTR